MKGYYFTKDVEDAIIVYNEETNIDVRNAIFSARIYGPLRQLTEQVYRKVSKGQRAPRDSERTLVDEGVSYLYTKLHLYDVERGSAFTYFSAAARHYFSKIMRSQSTSMVLLNMACDDEMQHSDVQRYLNHHAESTERDIQKTETSSNIYANMARHLRNNREDIMGRVRTPECYRVFDAVSDIVNDPCSIDSYEKRDVLKSIRTRSGVVESKFLNNVFTRLRRMYSGFKDSIINDLEYLTNGQKQGITYT